MKSEPIKFCWLDLGDGTVCERLLGHEPPCSADPAVDFPITSAVRVRAENDDEYRRRLDEAVDTVESTGFSGAGIRARLAELAGWADDSPTWDCPHCDWPPSHNPNDIANHYCGHCHHFCEDIGGS